MKAVLIAESQIAYYFGAWYHSKQGAAKSQLQIEHLGHTQHNMSVKTDTCARTQFSAKLKVKVLVFVINAYACRQLALHIRSRKYGAADPDKWEHRHLTAKLQQVRDIFCLDVFLAGEVAAWQLYL